MPFPRLYFSPAILTEYELSGDDVAVTRIESAPKGQLYGYLATLFVLFFTSSSLGIGDEILNLNNEVVQVSVALNGGGITEFRFLDHAVNPLNWEMGRDSEFSNKPYLRGHFLCLDRWGAPSDAELENGMTFHGEAAYASWRLVNREGFAESHQEAEMVCELPIAQMTVRRLMRLEGNQAVLVVREHITNTGKLGRIYNVVQHPSIAPPFLNPDTIVDSNAQYGFVQGSAVPESVAAADLWPNAAIQGELVDLRRFQHDDPGASYSDVSSFIFDEAAEYGWVTASSPSTGPFARLYVASRSLSMACHLAGEIERTGGGERTGVRDDRSSSTVCGVGASRSNFGTVSLRIHQC